MSFTQSARRMVSRAVAATLLISAVAVDMTVSAPSASASGTVLFNQPFHDNTVDGPAGSVSLPTAPTGGANFACLSAAGNATKNPLASCTTSTDAQGSGKLRFTSAVTGQEGGVFASTSVPTSQGLDVTFNSYQYGGTGADGMAFALAAVNPANPVTPAALGQSGGSLGYSAFTSTTTGLTDGYLGVGFDTFGNFSNKFEGTGCTDPANIAQKMPGQVVVRGPGNGTVGYCALQSSAATASSPSLTLRAATRAASLVPVEVVFNPTSGSITTPSGLVVPAGDYDVNFTPVGGAARSLVGALPVVPAGLYPSSWVNSSGFPKQLAFGWVGSTGSVTDFHEVDNVVVSSLNPVPQLSVSQTSYAAATLSAGSPVTYTVAAGSTGATENFPVTVTETLPAGVLPVGASGPGWVCAAPSGQNISCTNSASPFTSGTITVNGVVNTTGVTPALIQSSTSAIASSADASPATSSSAAAGTVPAAPVVTTITPAAGAAGGGGDVTVAGTNLSGATAIEIGTTAEFAAGTAATLSLCSASAPGCFTVTSATALDISAMPAHLAASVTVKVVSLGAAGSGTYTYNPGPALLFPAPPGGEAGVIYSDQLTVTGGTSPFTWSVSAGTLPPGLTLGASTGLLAGTPTTAGSYSFTVKVTDSGGQSNTEAVSLTVIPGPSLSFPTPPAGWTHTVYGDTLTESGGTSPFTWSVSSGSPPGGISLSADGNLSGTPTATGTFSFTVKVTDANGQTATEATSLSVSAGVSTTFAAPPGAEVGAAYSDTLTATGGTTPYTWSVNAGSLPAGITLTSAGVLAGTPAAAGSFAFSVNVIDQNNGIATTPITLVVAAGVSLSFAAPPGADINAAYSDTLTATGGTAPYTWSVSSGTPPAGITLNASTGVLAGTPTALGTSSFTVKVTDASGQSATKATSITVVGGPVLSFAAPPSGEVSAAYTDTLTVTGGTSPYTWSVSSGTPPAGITLNASTGVLAGTPTAAGTSSFTVKVTDANGQAATEATSLTVVSGPALGFAPPPPGEAGVAYSDPLTVTGGTGPFAWSIAAGSLPPGLTLSPPAGVLSGTPSAAGSYSFTVKVTDAAGQSTTEAATVVIAARPALSFAAPPSGQVGVAYSDTLTVTGGTGPFAWSVLAGSLPPGLTLGSSSGVLSGTPAAAGSYAFTVQVTDADGVTATESVTQVIGAGPLIITATADTSSAAPGGTVHFTVTATNTSAVSFTGVTFTDPLAGVLDDAAYNGDATATTGTVSFATPNLTWTGNLAPGATATITFSVTVKNPDTGNGVLASTITSATLGSNCPAAGTDPRCTTTVTVSGLTITSTADVASTTPGSTVHYTVTVTNSGQTPFTGATFTDPLAGVIDDAAYNANATATTGTVSFASPNLTWTGNLPPGGTATVTFSVTVKNPDTGDGILAATIVSATAGSNCPAAGTDPRCTTTVTVSGLTITSTADVASTTPGGTVHYTVTVTNSGQTPFTGATFTDPLAGVIDDASYNGDATTTTGTVSFTSPNLTWTGNLAAAATATITFSVTVRNPFIGDGILAATIVSATAGNNCPAGGTDPRCTTTVTVSGLTITNTAGVASTTPGATVSYTVTVTNSGQTPFTGATFTDPLAGVIDDAAYNANATTTTGTVSFTSPNLTWTGNLAAAATATITFSVTVKNPDTGNGILAATIVSATAGSNCPAAGTDPRCTATVTVAQLTIINTANVSTTTPGGVVRYTATFTNTGQVPFTGISISSNITDVLDDAVPDGDQTATSGTLTLTSTGITWTGDIPVGGTVTVTGTVTVRNPDPGNKVMASTLTSAAAGNNCPAGGTDPRCTATVNVLLPGLTIVKSADVSTTSPGAVVHYTVTVTDTGQTAYTGATFTDQLDGVLTDAAYNGDASATSGTVTYSAPDLTWTGNLAVGAAATITYSVTVNNPDTGDRTLVNTVISATPGSNCPVTGVTAAQCTATVSDLVPSMDIVTSASTATTTPGAVVDYTVTVTNTGPTAFTGATFTDPLAGVLDDAAYNGGAAATAGTVTFASPSLTWTGNLAVGASAVITFSVTVNNPDTGNQILASTVTSATAGGNCPAGGTDAACTVTVDVAQLAIANVSNVTSTVPGGIVRYTATFTNTGQVFYDGITIATNATDVFDDAVPNGDQTATSGSLTVTATGVTWTGDIPIGGTVTVTGTVTVDNPDTGNHVLTATLSSAAPGNNCPPGGTDPACTTSVPVLTPALTITKTASAAATVPGATLGYTITITDTGQTPYTAATVTDSLAGLTDDAAYDNNATATAGTLAYDSQALTLTWTGNLAAGAAAVITYTVTVSNPATGDKVIINTVTSAATGSTCPPATTLPACRVIVPVLTPALDIVKTASAATAVPGATITYTITATDTGQTPYTGAAFTDSLSGVLDDAAYNNNATATSGSLTYTAPNLTWTGNLNPGDTATITYTITISNPDTSDQMLVNTITSTTAGNNCPTGSTDPACTATVETIDAATLTIITTANTAAATAGAVVGFTVTIANSGLTPYAGATFTDPLAGVLDDAAYNGDAAATAGTVTYAAPVLTWTGTVPATGAVTVTYSVTVNNPDTGNQILASTVTSPSSGSNCAASSTDPRCTVTVGVAGLAIANVSNVTSTVPGGIVRYTATFTNTGQVFYDGITIATNATDVFDDAVPNGDQTATSGSLTVTATGVTWTGDIPIGGTVTVTGTVTVDNPDTGNHVLTATLSSAAPGNNCPPGGTDPACTTSVPVLTPALTITKTASAAATVPGATLGYTITITDTGQTPYTAATVTDSLAGLTDDAAYDNNATATAGTLAYDSQALTLTWTGNLAAGAAAVITYTVTVSNPATGDKVIINTVTSAATGSTCPPATTLPACRVIVPVLTPALDIVKTASAATAVPGATITYTITATDTGQTPYTGAAFTDSLSGVLDDAAYNNNATATSGSLTYTAPNLTWTGNLNPGDTATITYTITISNPDTSDQMLVNTITSTTAGNNCPTGSTDPACTATVDVTQLTITNTADVATSTPGGTINYTVTAANTGQVPIDGAAYTVDLTDVLDDAAYNGDGTATSGSLTLNTAAQNLTWTGDLAPGSTTTVTFSVTVNDPDTGNQVLLTDAADSVTPGNNCPAGSTDPRCTSSVTILTPVLAITKTASTSTTTPGSAVQYTITIADTGQTPYTGATVTDNLTSVLDEATYNGDATATTGALTFTSPTLTWTGNLAVGATATITYSVTVSNPATGGKLLINTVSSTAAGSACPPGSENSGCSVTVGILTPALTITKTASTQTTMPGDTVRYTITITNTGQTAYAPAAITDPLTGVLDDATYDSDATATAGTVTYTAPTLTWTGNLNPGAAATITYSVIITSPDTGNLTLTNTAASSSAGSNCPAAGGTDPRCSATVTVIPVTIALINLSSNFFLSGLPDTTAQQAGAVTMTVITNNPTGYDITVQATTAALTATGITDSIPVSDLLVRESGQTAYQPLSDTAPDLVHQQGGLTPPSGSLLSNDYEINIPFVQPGTYSTTLTYIATATP